MAFTRKPLAELSPAYRRRIERAEAQGFTRSQARGHAKTTELPITQIRLASLPKNSSYLLKEVRKHNDPNLTKKYNALLAVIKKMKKYPKGSAEYEREAKIRDKLARDLAHDLRNQDMGRDLYAVPTYGKKSRVEPEELEEDFELYQEDNDIDAED